MKVSSIFASLKTVIQAMTASAVCLLAPFSLAETPQSTPYPSPPTAKSSSSSAPSNPAFWKATYKKGEVESTVYLLGSVHFGHDNFYPLPEKIESAYRASDILAVEVDITKVQPQMVFKYAGLPGGKKLSQVLKPDVYQQLKAYSQANQIPVSAFDSFQPWFVAMQLVQAALAKTDFSAAKGVDMNFLMRKDKRVEEIESMEKQLKLFTGFSDEDQNVFLKQTLDDMAESQKFLAIMMGAWRSGDLDTIDKEMIQPMREMEEAKTLYNVMFTDRNIHMADAVKTYLTSGKNVFFVVGAAHMIGDDGIVSLLKQQGFTVKRVQ